MMSCLVAGGRVAARAVGVGLAVAGLAAGAADAATPSKVLDFNRRVSGSNPYGGMVSDGAGNLYGTTTLGGANSRGTVFRISTAGGAPTYTRLFDFNGAGTGSNPYGQLALDGAGNLYGTTMDGGSAGLGTVFKLSVGGGAPVYTKLMDFTGGAQGRTPYAGVSLDAAGNLYGTTQYGGAGDVGTVWRIAQAGGAPVHTKLWDFQTATSGRAPYGGVVANAAGDLFGTTYYGGAKNKGTLYRISGAAGVPTFTKLLDFTGANGANAQGALAFDAAGDLLGMTRKGGAANLGTVFRVSLGGAQPAYAKLLDFTGANGSNPYAGLIVDGAGAVFGTTLYGGAADKGVVFKLSGGGYEKLMDFDGAGNGANPFAGLVADASGDLYGTARYGGLNNVGTLFRISGAGFDTGATGRVGLFAASAVPEPGTWATMIVGFGLVGAGLRRKRVAATA